MRSPNVVSKHCIQNTVSRTLSVGKCEYNDISRLDQSVDLVVSKVVKESGTFVKR
jgi:hypothetical protein